MRIIIVLCFLSCLACGVYAQQISTNVELGSSNKRIKSGKVFFIGSDGTTKCRLCQIDCQALEVFSSCVPNRYFNYGCHIQTPCLSIKTSAFQDRFAAIAFCVIWNKCKLKFNNINKIDHVLNKHGRRDTIWVFPDPNEQLKNLFNTLERHKRNPLEAFLHVRKQIIDKHFTQQHVRTYVRFKVVQDLRDIRNKYPKDKVQTKVNEYFDNYMNVPVWFSQALLLPGNIWNELEDIWKNPGSLTPDEVLMTNLNYYSSEIVSLYSKRNHERVCAKNDYRNTACDFTGSPRDAIAYLFNTGFVQIMSYFGTYGEYHNFQDRSRFYKYFRIFAPLIGTRADPSQNNAQVTVPRGYKIIAVHYISGVEDYLRHLYPKNANTWYMEVSAGSPGFYVKPIALLDPYDVYQLKISTVTIRASKFGHLGQISVPNHLVLVSGGSRLISVCGKPVNANTKVFVSSSYPVSNKAWAVSYSTLDKSLFCQSHVYQVYAVTLQRKPDHLLSPMLQRMFPPIISLVESEAEYGSRAGCSTIKRGVEDEFAVHTLVSGGLTQPRKGFQVEKNSVMVSFISHRDSYATASYFLSSFMTPEGVQRHPGASLYQNEIRALTIYTPLHVPTDYDANETCEKRWHDRAKSIARHLPSPAKLTWPSFKQYWREYQTVVNRAPAFQAQLSICTMNKECTLKTCTGEYCY